MKKLVISGFVVAVVVGATILFLLNQLVEIADNCIYYNQRQAPNTITVLGRVSGTTREGNWYVSRFKICDRLPFNFASIKLYTPRDVFFSLGEEGVYEGTASYQWQQFKTSEITSKLNVTDLYAVQLEELISEADIMKLFQDFQDIECENIPICQSKIDFLKTKARGQQGFFSRLKQNQPALMLDFLSSRAKAYTTKFGKVESASRFKELTTGLFL